MVEDTLFQKELHKKRRMFYILNGRLIIAEPGLDDSHEEWFIKQGLLNEKNTIQNITRGIVDDRGDVWFYTGEDFEITSTAEKEFFEHLKELIIGLGVDERGNVYGGKIKKSADAYWPPRKIYGKISDFLRDFP